MIRASAFAVLALASGVLLLPGREAAWRALERSEGLDGLERLLAPELESADRARAARILASARLRAGDAAGELEIRERLRAWEPGDAENLRRLLDLALASGRLEDAWTLAGELARVRPSDRVLRERLVEIAEWSGRTAEAAPHAVWLHERGHRGERLSRVFAAKGDVDRLCAGLASPRDRALRLAAFGAQAKAIDALREHLADSPDDVDSRALLARLYLWTGRTEEAARQIEICLKERDDPELRSQYVALARALQRIDLVLPHLPDGVEKAEFLLALGRADEAREIYRRLGESAKLLSIAEGRATEEEEVAIREAMPMTLPNRQRLAALYVWRKQYDKAIPIYEELGEERAVDLHLVRGDREAAIRVAKKLDLPLRLGELYLWKGDVAAAIREFERVPSLEAELPRLYLRAGRTADAVRLLEKLDLEPHVKAELFFYAGKPERAVGWLESLDPSRLDPVLVFRLTHLAADPVRERLLLLVLKLSPDDVLALTELAGVFQRTDRKERAAGILRDLVRRYPADLELAVTLALLVNDPRLLKAAYERGSREPELVRRLAELALEKGERDAAEALFREYLKAKPDDYGTRFQLAELTNDAEEYRRTLASLPAGERILRLRILLWQKDLTAALSLVRSVEVPELHEALVDLLLEAGREKEALDLGLTPRQRAVLALKRGQYAEALALLRGLDSNEPSVIRAQAECLLALGRFEEAERLVPGIAARARVWRAVELGRSAEALALLDRVGDGGEPALKHLRGRLLYDLGRWQEAEPWADDALRREIRGRYGPEGFAGLSIHRQQDEERFEASARYRWQLSGSAALLFQGGYASVEGAPGGVGAAEVDLERAEAGPVFALSRDVELSLSGGGFRDEASGACGGAELRVSLPAGYGAAGLRLHDPWIDSIEVAVNGVRRNRVGVQAGVLPQPWLHLSAGLEGGRFEAELGAIEGEGGSDRRVRFRAELLPLRSDALGPQSFFFDSWLRSPAAGMSYLGLSAQAEFARTDADDAVLAALQLVPESRPISFGPVAAWSNGTSSLGASAYVGLDEPRDLAFGEFWGLSATASTALSASWRLGTGFEYVSEERTSSGGAGWTWTLGGNLNF